MNARARVWTSDNTVLFLIGEYPLYLHAFGVYSLEWTTQKPGVELVLRRLVSEDFLPFHTESYEGKNIEIHFVPCGQPDDYNAENSFIRITKCKVISKWLENVTPNHENWDSKHVMAYILLEGESLEFHPSKG